jgi:hypothetical protein
VDKKLTTGEVAKRLGVSRQHLNVVITRNPELRPKNKLQAARFSAYLWSEEEVTAVAQYINRGKSVSTE